MAVSSEAKYVSLSVATQEAIWIWGLLTDLNQPLNGPTMIYEDNTGCICMPNNLECKRSKQIDIKHHFIRDHIANGTIELLPFESK